MFADVASDIPSQVMALRWLIHQAYGSSAILQMAVDRVNQSGLIPKESVLDWSHKAAFQQACDIMGIQAPSEFTLHPINSPGTLLFWRCITAILASCTIAKRREFYYIRQSKHLAKVAIESQPQESATASASSSDLDSVSEEEFPLDLDDFVVVDEVSNDSSDDNFDSKYPDAPEVLDSCFHFDRTCQSIWNDNASHTVEEMIAYSYSDTVLSKPGIPVCVVGGVMVYSDPNTYPPVDFKVQGPWKVAVGVHPRHFETLTVERTMHRHQLLDHPQVVALGECGLDRTIAIARWSLQDEVFRKLIQMAKPDQPLVLQLRGVKGDVYSSDVYARGLMMLEATCSTQQKMHIYCFLG